MKSPLLSLLLLFACVHRPALAAAPDPAQRTDEIASLQRLLAEPDLRPETHAEILLRLGDAQLANGRSQEALTQYTALLKQYPSSAAAPDAWLALGEIYFADNNLLKAFAAYKHAASYTQWNGWAYAEYKLAWCLFNLGEFADAIAALKVVIQQPPPESPYAPSALLQTQALSDLVRFYAEADALDDATATFTALGRADLVRSTVRQLAQVYFDQARYEAAIPLLRRLIAEAPLAPDALALQIDILWAYERMNRWQEALLEATRLARSYGPASAWARANATSGLATALASREQALRQLALDLDLQARKLGHGQLGAETRALATQAAGIYLEQYTDVDRSDEIWRIYGILP